MRAKSWWSVEGTGGRLKGRPTDLFWVELGGGTTTRLARVNGAITLFTVSECAKFSARLILLANDKREQNRQLRRPLSHTGWGQPYQDLWWAALLTAVVFSSNLKLLKKKKRKKKILLGASCFLVYKLLVVIIIIAELPRALRARAAEHHG